LALFPSVKGPFIIYTGGGGWEKNGEWFIHLTFSKEGGIEKIKLGGFKSLSLGIVGILPALPSLV
jgi:hypothetical protein